MAKEARWKLLTLIVVCWAIAASMLAAHYYTLQLLKPAPSKLSSVVLILDYGNGSFHIYNLTGWRPPITLFNLTYAVAKVNYTVYTGLGVFVTSINDVANNPAENRYWIWWYWDGRRWVEGPVGAGAYELQGGEVVCWYYSVVDPSTWKVSPPSSKLINVELGRP